MSRSIAGMRAITFYEVVRDVVDEFGVGELVLVMTSDPKPGDVKTGREEMRLVP